MQHDRAARRALSALMAVLLMSLVSVPDSAGWSGPREEEARSRSEWEAVREQYERKLRTHEKRIAEMAAQEREVPPDRRAEKITSDRIAGARARLKGGGHGKALAETAEHVAGQAAAVGELSGARGEDLDIAIREWGTGAERRKLREAHAMLQKNLERIAADLAMAIEAAEAMSAGMEQSGVIEQAARSDAAARDAIDRLSARWERERAARERERAEREREAAERARGTRRP